MRFAAAATALLLVVTSGLLSPPARSSDPGSTARVPEHTLLVKGAWSSASDDVTPLPEGGTFVAGAYQNAYFGLRLPFSSRWQAGLEGPPVSDNGYYVLAQVVAAEPVRTQKPGHVLVAAQDLFFTPTQAASALELVSFSQQHLDTAVYQVERMPTSMKLGARTFVRLDYFSPSAQLHWQVLATQIRCHVVEFVFTSAHPQMLAELVQGMSRLQGTVTAGVPGDAGADEAPVCIKDYAVPENLIAREEPILSEPRFNPIPVRIIIDRQGRVRHIHFLRAFPDQAKNITDAVMQWRFKPHLEGGRPVEVETGIMFGRKSR